METVHLLNFCKKYNYVICYGAGDIASKIEAYLHLHGVNVEAFCISDNHISDKKLYGGKPIYHLSEIPYHKGDCGIIIAVNEQFHQEIQMNLVQHKLEYFLVTQAIFYNIMSVSGERIVLRNAVKYISLVQAKVISSTKIKEYEQRIKFIKKNFNKVEMRYLAVSVGGCLVGKKYYDDSYENVNNNFILLYAYNASNEFKEPNSFVLKKIKGDYFEVVDSENIYFWNYYLVNYFEMFLINGSNIYFDEVIPAQIKELRENIFFIQDKHYLHLNDEDINTGRMSMESLGIKNKFICFFARDSRYYKEAFNIKENLIDIMDIYRNSDIETYKIMAKYFYEQFNFQSVRMGKLQTSNTSGNGIVDYANLFHSDFLDVYLASECEFFIGDPSGVNLFFSSFSKPIVLTNIPLVLVHHDGSLPLSKDKDLMIFQKFWDKNKGRYLTFKEMMKCERSAKMENFKFSGITNIFDIYYKNGIVPIKNTAQEILDVALEMKMKLNGKLEYDEEDKALQEKYRAIVQSQIKEDPELFWYDARIGRAFLRDNEWLLE